MRFSELPLDVARVVFEECVLQWGLWHAVRHRLVSRFFDREIRHAICTTRYLERYHTPGRQPNRELRQQYLEYVIRIGNPGNVNLARAIQDSVRSLSAESQDSSVDDLTRRTKLLCKEAVQRTPLRPVHWLSSGPVSREPSPCHPHAIVENTLLTAAIVCGDIFSRPDLLENADHLSASNLFFVRPLACAAASGSQEAVNILLGKGARDLFANGESAIDVAAERGHNEIIKALLDADADGAIYGRGQETFHRLFISAAQGGQLSTIQMLLANGFAVDNKAMTNLEVYYAAMGGHEAVVRFLLKNTTFRPETPGVERPWHVGALSKSPKIAEMLMDTFTYEEFTLSEAAARAAGRGNLNTFRYIYARNPTTNLKSVLQKASRNGRYEVVRYVLTELQPSTDVVWYPLRVAAERGFDSILRLLYTYGSKSEDWQAIGKSLRTCFKSAKGQRQLHVVHTLTEFSKTAVEHVSPVNADLASELKDLMENKTRVDLSALLFPTSSPLCQSANAKKPTIEKYRE